MTDEAAVSRFEELIHAQPRPQPWVPVTPYDLESRRIVEGKHPELILQHLAPDDAHILDYGCGPGQVLVRLLREASIPAHPDRAQYITVRGYDPQIAGSEAWTDQSYVYNLVICREVLEHCLVLQIPTIIRELVRLCDRHGLIYVTTRFAKAPDHFLSVEDERDIDPTHITCLTKPFLRTLFVMEGCRSRPDLEVLMDWQGKGRCLVFEAPR